MKHLSLFSGIGGIDLAAEWAGFESSIMVERDKFCQRLLKQNFPDAELFDDVTTFNGLDYRGEITLLSAGFPCQPHSLAGKRKASGDERDLWGEVVRILGEVQPRWFLGENVPGLLSSESGRFFGRVVNDLDKMGYRMGWGMYGAKDVGAVHRRNRVFIVAYSNCFKLNVGQARQPLPSGKKQEQPNRSYLKRNAPDPQSESGDGGGLGEQLCSESQASEFRGGYCQGDVTNANVFRYHKLSNQEGQQSESWRQTQCESQRYGSNIWKSISGGDWREWDTCPIVYETRSESRIRGKNDGVPNRMDRLKALGNAVVPQQVYPILAEIARLENER